MEATEVLDERRPSALSDWRSNRGQPHIQVALLLFRLAGRSRASRSITGRTAAKVIAAAYRGYALTVTSIDIPTRTLIGPRLAIRHGFGLVVHADARIGADVTLRHGVTIGARTGTRHAPVIRSGTDVGSGAQIIGDVTVGEGARIGSGAVVVRDVPDGATAVGNPARILGQVGR
jgi:serine acetyltransferase